MYLHNNNNQCYQCRKSYNYYLDGNLCFLTYHRSTITPLTALHNSFKKSIFYSVTLSNRCCAGEVGVRCPCIYCLFLAHRISFSTRAPVQSLITANQRKTDARILISGRVENHGHRKLVRNLPNRLKIPEDRAHDRN